MNRLVWIAVSALVLVFGCGKAPESLLARLPAGSDIYASVDPEKISLNELMGRIEEAFPQASAGVAAMQSVLGFSPLRWSSWQENLGLRAEGRLALVVRMENEEPQLVCLVLPTDDPAPLEELLEKVPQAEATFWVSQWNQEYVLLAMSEEESYLSDFRATLDGPSLGSGESLALLRGEQEGEEPAVELYGLPEEEDVGAVYVSVTAEGSRLVGRFAALPTGRDYEQFGAAVLASGSAGSDMRFPDDLMAMGRLSLDTREIARIAGDRMPPDANAGLAFLGFGSIEEFMAAFNGDIFLGMAEDITSPRLVGAIGVADEEAVSGILTRLQGIMSMSGEQSVESFTFEGRPAFRMEAPIQGGTQTVEVGLGYGVFYVVTGYSLSDVSGWRNYDALSASLGAESPGDGAGHLTIDLSKAMDLAQSQSGVDLGDLPELGWASLRLRAEDRVMVVEASVDTGSSEPFLAMADLFLAIGRQLQAGAEESGMPEISSPPAALEPQSVVEPGTLPPPPPPGEPEPLEVGTQ
ncbi:hypothetical protein GF402_07015 [Candidatus Fermentibacteria bacterium]|nr:hypothetical protein [Candidatus Fermentibacteria bacterium]